MKTHIIYILLLLLLVSACSTEKKGESKKVTAKSQSAPYELLIVADKEWIKTQTGELFVDAIARPIEGLPQIEPSFRVTTINPSAFNSTFRTYSNIVRVEIAKKYEKASVSWANDVYCTPQLITTFQAPDEQALLQFLSTEGTQKAVDLLNEQEFQRERKLLSKHFSNVVMKETKKMFGCSINAPQDIDQVKKGTNFLWGSASKQDFRLNVCIYSLPLSDLSVPAFVASRDSVMKINIPGDRDDQWMETDSRTVSARLTSRDGNDIMVIRGLWDMRHDAMGGPFVSYVQSDKTNNRLIVTEGFVFAPEEKKRPLIRELESMLQTLVLP